MAREGFFAAIRKGGVVPIPSVAGTESPETQDKRRGG